LGQFPFELHRGTTMDSIVRGLAGREGTGS
jgi:hypothetical protein